MPSKNRIVGYLMDEDYELFKIAEEKYEMTESGLVKEIIHAWLFSNKLQLKK
jgi:hypothetical protein